MDHALPLLPLAVWCRYWDWTAVLDSESTFVHPFSCVTMTFLQYWSAQTMMKGSVHKRCHHTGATRKSSTVVFWPGVRRNWWKTKALFQDDFVTFSSLFLFYEEPYITDFGSTSQRYHTPDAKGMNGVGDKEKAAICPYRAESHRPQSDGAAARRFDWEPGKEQLLLFWEFLASLFHRWRPLCFCFSSSQNEQPGSIFKGRSSFHLMERNKIYPDGHAWIGIYFDRIHSGTGSLDASLMMFLFVPFISSKPWWERSRVPHCTDVPYSGKGIK